MAEMVCDNNEPMMNERKYYTIKIKMKIIL